MAPLRARTAAGCCGTAPAASQIRTHHRLERNNLLAHVRSDHGVIPGLLYHLEELVLVASGRTHDEWDLVLAVKLGVLVDGTADRGHFAHMEDYIATASGAHQAGVDDNFVSHQVFPFSPWKCVIDDNESRILFQDHLHGLLPAVWTYHLHRNAFDCLLLHRHANT